MNTIFIVLPILTLLMFDLGLTLQPNDFLMVFQRPKAVLIGLIGQLLILPPDFDTRFYPKLLVADF